MLSELLAFFASLIMIGLGLAASGVALMFFADAWSCLSAHKEACHQTIAHFRRKNKLAREETTTATKVD